MTDDELIIYDIITTADTVNRTYNREELLERTGPREKIYFDPTKVHAAIITCGGLCPGLNDVVRAIVLTLWESYGVRRICGIKYGYRGIIPEFKIPVMDLNPTVVENIHRMGGTILGSSRGSGDRVEEIVNSLEQMNINMLFTIGGDGTQKGALDIANEVIKRGLKIAVVGIPKTIDNDLSYTQKSFGFETAVEYAVEAVSGAHVEAHDAVNGIGLVKVMGRESGFIAAHTALASNDVNFALIPEVPFDLEGEQGLLAALEDRLHSQGHVVLLVAEGAGQELIRQSDETDASGNIKLGDIGLFLKQKIGDYFKQKNMETNLKYIDPSYIIRSAPANPSDSLYCQRLGNNAVHAAMAGKTAMLVNLVNNHMVHVPIKVAVAQRNHVEPDGSLWRDVLNSTGQPPLMKN
jgi:6-phosphofructokinase 1